MKEQQNQLKEGFHNKTNFISNAIFFKYTEKRIQIEKYTILGAFFNSSPTAEPIGSPTNCFLGSVFALNYSRNSRWP
jgi:hypothetical protein